MAVNAGQIPCIIHFEGKDGPQKQLSNETLRTFIQRRKEWLQLPDTCELEKYHQSRDIAKRSYDYLAYDIENVEELPEAVLSSKLLSKFHGHYENPEGAENCGRC